MSDDGNFQVTPEWKAIKLATVAITNGIFSVTSRGDVEVVLARRSAQPSADEPGSYVLKGTGSAVKYSLDVSEKLYAKTSGSGALIGVIAA